jgi:hypothetical protein
MIPVFGSICIIKVTTKSSFGKKGSHSMFKVKKDEVKYVVKSVRMTEEMITKIQELAGTYGVSFNNIVVQCIEYALDDMKTADRE